MLTHTSRSWGESLLEYRTWGRVFLKGGQGCPTHRGKEPQQGNEILIPSQRGGLTQATSPGPQAQRHPCPPLADRASDMCLLPYSSLAAFEEEGAS